MTPKHFCNMFSSLFIQIRRELHQVPELGTKEEKTGKIILNYLEKWNIPYQYPLADTGIVAIITGTKTESGNTIALRSDMDGLPLLEPEETSYHSLHPGIMHACGHDAHMAIALGCALYFQENREDFSGCVKIFFQPAEETVGGAKRMIQEGCMDTPKVDFITGLHVAPTLEIGEIELKYGKFYASSDEVTIILQGKSCHGAYPDLGTDAIVMSAALISSLQTFVSRRTSPLDQVVLTLGTIEGGSTHNTLANQVTITGALRTTEKETRISAIKYIKQQTNHIAAAFGGTGKVEIVPGYPALINTDCIVDFLKETALPIIGRESIYFKEKPGMGVEDFSFFLEHTPGVFYHLGCGNKERNITSPLHSEGFDIDENCLEIGVLLQLKLTLGLLERKVS